MSWKTVLVWTAGLWIGLMNVSSAEATSTFSNSDKGVSWAMGSWYVNGAYNWTGMTGDLDKMRDAGINWVRFSFGKQTQSSCSSTGFYSRLADEMDKRGIHGMPSLSIPNRTTTTATDTELQDYRNWLTTMVNCYKGRFHDWEVWNEPNISNYWNISQSTTDDAAYAQSVGYYIAYLKTSYETIKAIDPQANVINGGIAQEWKITLTDGRVIGTMSRWMNEFIKQGGYQYIDSWGFHPYADYDPAKNYTYNGIAGCGAANIARLDEFKSYANSSAVPAEHRNKPIWLTEIGFTSTADEYPGNTKGSEATKAACLTSIWQLFRNQGILSPIFWFDMSQDNLDPVRQYGYSLVPSNKVTGEAKTNAAYDAYKNLWASAKTAGDANNDAKVDGVDYVIWLNNFGIPLTDTLNPADFNGDKSVDNSDFDLWLAAYIK